MNCFCPVPKNLNQHLLKKRALLLKNIGCITLSFLAGIEFILNLFWCLLDFVVHFLRFLVVTVL